MGTHVEEWCSPPSIAGGGDAKWCICFRRSFVVSHKINIPLPQHPGILLLGIYPK